MAVTKIWNIRGRAESPLEYIANPEKTQREFTDEQKQAADTYYTEQGRCISRVCRKLGYPSREVLGPWINELAPDQKKHCRTSNSDVEYPQELKEQAVIELCARDGSAQDVTDRYGVSRYSLYNKYSAGLETPSPIERATQSEWQSQSDSILNIPARGNRASGHPCGARTG